MELTVQDIMKLDPLVKAKVVAGQEKMKNVVTGVTIIEAPDIINWLAGGEVLLTSLYSLKDQEADYFEMIRNLVSKNVSALIIKVGRVVEEVPQAIIDGAKEFGLPVIELEGSIRFVDIMYPIMAELFDKQVLKLKYYKEVQERFTSLALECEGFESIVNNLKDLVGNPVGIFDNHYNCLACTDPDLKCFYESSKQSPGESLGGKFYYYSQTVKLDCDEGKEINQVVVPIKAFRHVKGYLIVYEVEKPLRELDYTSLTSAATVVSLEMVKRFAISEVEQRHKNDLIDNLVMGRIDSKRQVLERANLIGWDLSRAFAVMVVNIHNINHYLVENTRSNNMLLEKVQSEVFELTATTVKKYVKGSILGIKGDSIIVLWPGKQDDHVLYETIKKAGKKLTDKVHQRFSKIQVGIGIGTLAEGIENIAQSYGEAQDAIAFGGMFEGNEAIVTFAELGVFRILCKFAEKNSLNDYIPESLIKLIEHDKQNESELLDTLQAFLENNGNASKAAKALFIHYKTILYRLERIKEITKLDFEKEKDRLEVEIGLKILRLNNQRKNTNPRH